MEPKKFIEIFTKKDFRKEIIKDLKKEIEAYPYFSPVIIAYLLTLRLNDDPSFNNELKKYAIYISNRQHFIKLLYEIELIKEKIKYKLTPEEAEALEKEIYERSKQKHEQIIREIIEPKIAMLRKLAELSKEQKAELKQTNNTTQSIPKENEEPSITDIKTTQSQITEPEEKVPPSSEKVELKVTITPSKEEKIKQDKKEEREEKIKQTKEPISSEKKEKVSSQQKAETAEEQKKEEEKVVSIDDIFNKIAELKRQKLSAKEEFTQRVTNIDKLLEEQKSREEITEEVKTISPEDRPRPTTKQTKNMEENKTQTPVKETIIIKEEKEPSKPHTEKKEPEKNLEKEEPSKSQTVEKIPEKTLEKKETSKPQPEKKEPEKNLEKKESSKSQPEKKIDLKHENIEEDIIELDLSIPEEVNNTKEKTTEEKQKEAATLSTEKTVNISTEIKQPQTTTTDLTKSPDTTSSTKQTKKTAADRILEEVRKRREAKQKQQQLIDKFLKEQPSIDRKKEPTIEGDLSEKATKEPDLVTEKMARIYELQELYDKAIETYEKLILKFPEKSDYFAKKLLELKQKINKK